jgi:hypothetical protein
MSDRQPSGEVTVRPGTINARGLDPMSVEPNPDPDHAAPGVLLSDPNRQGIFLDNEGGRVSVDDLGSPLSDGLIQCAELPARLQDALRLWIVRAVRVRPPQAHALSH